MFDRATRRQVPTTALIITDAGTPIGYVWPDPNGDGTWCLYSPYHAGSILRRHGRAAATGYVRGQHNRAKDNGVPNPMTAEE